MDRTVKKTKDHKLFQGKLHSHISITFWYTDIGTQTLTPNKRKIPFFTLIFYIIYRLFNLTIRKLKQERML